jgi:hypothetical protein
VWQRQCRLPYKMSNFTWVAEYYHAYYYIHWGTEPLSKLKNRTYNNLGLDLGGQIHYKLTKHLEVGITASYARYFSRLSPNELRFAFFGSVMF